MANRIRCPCCGRGVRLSTNMKKVVRHRVLAGGVSGTDLERPRVCPISGLSDWEARRYKLTKEALTPKPVDVPIPGWKPRYLP